MLPYRRAPFVNHGVSRLARCGSHYIPHRNSSPLLWEMRPNPLPGSLCQHHVSLLYLPAGKVFLNVQVKSDQGEDHTDRFCRFIGMLSRIRVHNMLVDKRRIRMRQGVARKFVIKILVRC